MCMCVCVLQKVFLQCLDTCGSGGERPASWVRLDLDV